MYHRKKYSSGVFALILFIAVVNIYTTCGKEQIGAPLYHFALKVDLAPARKSYSIGDTIWLTYNNPGRTFTDEPSGTVVPVDTASLQFQMVINNIYNTPISTSSGFFAVTGAYSSIVKSSYDSTSTGIGTFVGCPPAINYLFKIGIVPKIKGYYAFRFTIKSGLSSCSRGIADFPYSEVSYRFNLADCNKDVYLTIPANSRNNSKDFEATIDGKSTFVIQVN